MNKKIILLILLSIISTNLALANAPSTPAPAGNIPQTPKTIVSTNFEDCIKIYPISAENLFLLTLASINANGYKIDEIQSRNGLVSFFTGNKMLLASITKLNDSSSMIKITPMDNSYNFPNTIPIKLFNYINLNIK